MSNSILFDPLKSKLVSEPMFTDTLEILMPSELEALTDVVIAYRPKPKTKAAKRRIRRNKRKRAHKELK